MSGNRTKQADILCRRMDVQKKPSVILILVFLAGIVAYQIVSLVAYIDADFFSTYAATINYIYPALSAVSLLIVAILISVEMKNLEEFNIDKFTIVSFILFSILRLIFERGNISISIMIGLACVLMICAFFVTKPKIIRTNLRWAVLGIVVSAATLVPIAQFELLLRHSWLAHPLLQNNLTITAISHILKELSFTSLPEEILFRGFIWGYLRREGWGENKIIWAQGILFWLIHFSRLGTPFTFFVSIPILTLISSQLTKRSKQVFPAVLSHTIINAVSGILNLATF
jgi:hypothetical protein